MNRCTYLDETLQEHVSSQPPDIQRILCRMPKVKVTVTDFRILLHCEIGQKGGCTITNEPLHLACWNFVRTRISTTSSTL